MQDEIKRQVESVIQYRKHLAEVEARRSRCQPPIPAEIWQELADVSHRLEQAEARVRQTCLELAAAVNQARLAVMAALEDYSAWRERMRQVEDLFLTHVVHPGRHLKQAIRQREWLQREYQRILTAIQLETYSSQTALEADIRQVLTRGAAAFDPHAHRPEDEPLDDETPLPQFKDASLDELVQAVSRDELVKEFKRVVLPKIHPDTSNTPPEIFKTVFEVFQRSDLLLMEGYIAQYRGEIEPAQASDPLESMDQLLNTHERYQGLCARLQRRVDRLKADLTPQEIEDPEQLQQHLLRQRQEILARIQAEAEQILAWRDKIEGLTQLYQDRDRESGEDA